MRFRPPRRDDAPFVVVFILVNHRNFQAVHQANRMDASLAVVEAVINFFHRWPIKNALRILESDPMPDEIAAIFLSVPTVAHILYLHNVNMCRSCAWCAVFPVAQHRDEAILLFNSSAVTNHHPYHQSSPPKSPTVQRKPLFLRWITDCEGMAENKLKKRLDTCSSVIVNYNSAEQLKSQQGTREMRKRRH